MLNRVIKPQANGIVPVTRAAAIAEELRRLILTGEFPPGSRLRQAEIASRFQVSTTPVREAFSALARDGLVRQDAHRGVVVFRPSLDELVELYDIRGELEPLAAELAARQLTDVELDRLDELVVAMRTAAPKRSPQLKSEFHAAINAAADRPRLRDMIAGLREASASYLVLTVHHYDAGYAARAQAEHEEIVAAMRARAPKRAAKAMRTHLLHNRQHVGRLVE